MSKVVAQDHEKLAKALSDLSNASFCFAAVNHPEYTDPRKGVLLERARTRLEDAAADYHEIAMAIGFLNRINEPSAIV